MGELAELMIDGRRTVPEWIGRTQDEVPPPRVKLRVLLRNDRKCANCGNIIRGGKPFTCDHTVAIINGGENRERNLRPLCSICTPAKDAADNAEKARTASVQKSHYGVKRPRGTWKWKGSTYDWKRRRYVKSDEIEEAT